MRDRLGSPSIIYDAHNRSQVEGSGKERRLVIVSHAVVFYSREPVRRLTYLMLQIFPASATLTAATLGAHGAWKIWGFEFAGRSASPSASQFTQEVFITIFRNPSNVCKICASSQIVTFKQTYIVSASDGERPVSAEINA